MTPSRKREGKLQTFRGKRDRYFKEDPDFPLRENDKRKSRGIIGYPIDLNYAMIGAIEKYPTKSKPLYILILTNEALGEKYVKCGRFKFK
jgi:hypothetical protein